MFDHIRKVIGAVKKGKELYDSIGDGEKAMLNKGVEEIMKRVGPTKTYGDAMVRKMQDVETTTRMSPAEQARTLGERAKRNLYMMNKPVQESPMDKVFGSDSS